MQGTFFYLHLIKDLNASIQLTQILIEDEKMFVQIVFHNGKKEKNAYKHGFTYKGSIINLLKLQQN